MATIFVPDDFYCPITGELMKEPVSDTEGFSYEKSAILQWLQTNHTSPLTRNTLHPSDLTNNLSLKKSIESIRDKLTQDQLTIKSKLQIKENKPFQICHENITINQYYKDNQLLVSIHTPNIENRQSVDVVLCIDVSGSMGSEAVLKGDDGKNVSHGISVLSLTVSAAKTILHSLNEHDNLSIVTYTNTAKCIVNHMSCSNENKNVIETQLDELKPLSMTNLWDGIKTSLDILKDNSPQNRMKSIFVLTDGVPNVEPPRGHEYMIQKYFKQYDFHCMINCYGFGYSLKSDLLDNISTITGGDGYSFIPDASLLGNVFIHGISNFLSTAIVNPKLMIELSDGGLFQDNIQCKELYIPSLKYGKTKHILFTLVNTPKSNCIHSNVSLYIDDKIITNSDVKDGNDIIYIRQLCRYKVSSIINECIRLKKFNNGSFSIALEDCIQYLQQYSNDEYIQNILYDLNGQVKEALNMTSTGEKEDWFSKWGIHYLRSLNGAYINEICNNFKDKGVSNFTSELFNMQRDEISDIFDKLPQPKKTIHYSQNTYSRNTGPTSTTRSVNMSVYNNATGGCCARGCRIKMKDNTYKNVEDVKKGDSVITYDYNTKKYSVGEIECVVNTICNFMSENMVSMGKLKITPYHPIIEKKTGKWIYPKDLKQPTLHYCLDMYTFIVANRKPVIIEDYIFATFGHNLTGNVIEHPYFGTEKVIHDLKNWNSYINGNVTLTKDMIFRDKHTGLVNKIDYHIQQLSFIRNFHMSHL